MHSTNPDLDTLITLFIKQALESTCMRSLSTSIIKSDPNFPERISNASPYLACCSNMDT
uniref:Phagocyte signaling-impaired protein n=1 Tax=Rhizophora mucronata TaxID=61149 RepID=A0A2P2M6U3_RHIMU